MFWGIPCLLTADDGLLVLNTCCFVFSIQGCWGWLGLLVPLELSPVSASGERCCRYHHIHRHTHTHTCCFIYVAAGRVAYQQLGARYLYPFVNTYLPNMSLKTGKLRVRGSCAGVEYTNQRFALRWNTKLFACPCFQILTHPLVNTTHYLSLYDAASPHAQRTADRQTTMPVPHWTPVTIKSPSWACLALNRKGPGRRGGGVVVVCYTTLLSCPPRLAGRLGSGFGKGKGGRNLAGDREHQISRMFVCFLAGRACLWCGGGCSNLPRPGGGTMSSVTGL